VSLIPASFANNLSKILAPVPWSLCENSRKHVAPQALWSAAARRRFVAPTFGSALSHDADLKVSATATARASSQGKSGSKLPHSKFVLDSDIIARPFGDRRRSRGPQDRGRRLTGPVTKICRGLVLHRGLLFQEPSL